MTFEWRRSNGSIKRHRDGFEGILPPMERQFAEGQSTIVRKRLAPFMRVGICPACEGTRLKPEALSVKIEGHTLPDVTAMTVDRAHAFFQSLKLTETQARIAEDALKEIRGRLKFLLDVGLDYLTLNRTAPTLSGGEAQRIRLASQIGSGLVGVTYVLDEPSIGLHHRDNRRLLDALCRLRDVGNTVIVVEHDEDTMRRADRVVDFGPGPGHLGGRVIAEGSWKQIARRTRSVTGAYLSGKEKIAVPKRRPVSHRNLWIRGASQNNLKNIDAKIPVGVFTCVTGVSGSGKSSLIADILYPALARELNRAETETGAHRCIEGIDLLDKVIEINQQPIGRTPRSNAATYTGVFDPIRKLFAELPESKVRGYKPGRFSFNVKGGRCEACKGNGANLVEMDFLADVWVTCPVCEGRRFNRETLRREVQGQIHRRCAGNGSRRSASVFSGNPRHSPHSPNPNRCGNGLRQIGPARANALRRRSTTGQAIKRTVPQKHGQNPVHPGRAHDGPAFCRYPESLKRIASARRYGQFRGGYRAQPGRNQNRRLGHRPGT